MTEKKLSFFEYREKVLTDIKSRLSNLNDYGIIIFIAACCQRQVSVYIKASMNQSWSDTILIEKLVKSIWEYLLKNDNDPTRKIEVPDNLFEILSSASPEDPDGDIDNCAITCLSCIEILFEAIKIPQIENAITVSEESLEIISTLLYSILDIKVTSTSDVKIYGHRLMELEINRQLNDISSLRESCNQDTILKIYNQSINIDLTDGLWW